MISMDSSPDIIKDASDALKPIEDRGITVMQRRRTDGTYKREDFSKFV